MVRQTRTIKETVKEAQSIINQKGPRKSNKTIEETLREAEQYLNKGQASNQRKTRSTRHQIQPLKKRIQKPSPTKSSVSLAAREDSSKNRRSKNEKQSPQNSAQKQNGIIDNKVVVEAKLPLVPPSIEEELKDLSLSLSPKKPTRGRPRRAPVKALDIFTQNPEQLAKPSPVPETQAVDLQTIPLAEPQPQPVSVTVVQPQTPSVAEVHVKTALVPQALPNAESQPAQAPELEPIPEFQNLSVAQPQTVNAPQTVELPQTINAPVSQVKDVKDKVRVSSERRSEVKEKNVGSQERVTRSRIHREVQIQPSEAVIKQKAKAEFCKALSSQKLQPAPMVENNPNAEKQTDKIASPPPNNTDVQTKTAPASNPKADQPQEQPVQRRSTRLAKKSTTEEAKKITPKKDQSQVQNKDVTQQAEDGTRTPILKVQEKQKQNTNIETEVLPAASIKPIVEFPKQRSRSNRKKQPDPQEQQTTLAKAPEAEMASNSGEHKSQEQKANIDDFFNQIRKGRQTRTSKQQDIDQAMIDQIKTSQEVKNTQLEEEEKQLYVAKKVINEEPVQQSQPQIIAQREKSKSKSKQPDVQNDQVQNFKQEHQSNGEGVTIGRRSVGLKEEMPDEPQPTKKLKKASNKKKDTEKKLKHQESQLPMDQEVLKVLKPNTTETMAKDFTATKVEVERAVNQNKETEQFVKEEVATKSKHRSHDVFSKIENRGMTPMQEVMFLKSKEQSSQQKRRQKQLMKKKALQQKIKREFGVSTQNVISAQVYTIPKVAMLDVVFLVSSYDENSEYIEEISNAISKLESEIYTKCRREDLSVKYGIVAYQDHNIDDYYLTHVIDLEPFEEVLIKLKSLRFGNESNGAQAVFDGMNDAAIKIGWRQERLITYARYLFHIGDQPPHGSTFTQGHDKYPNGCPCRLTLDQIVHRINIRDIKYVMVKSANANVESLCKQLKKLLLSFKEVSITSKQLPDQVAKDILNELFPIEYY